MKFWIRLCSLFWRGWAPTALCRVAVRNSSEFPLYSFPCRFCPWGREATRAICLFRQTCRQTCPSKRIYWQSLWKELLKKKKSKYCLILNKFHGFSNTDIWVLALDQFCSTWIVNGGGGGLWPGKIQTSHLIQIYRYPFLLRSGKCTSPPVGLPCLPADVLVTCCCGLVSSDTSVKYLKRGKRKVEIQSWRLRVKVRSGACFSGQQLSCWTAWFYHRRCVTWVLRVAVVGFMLILASVICERGYERV